MKVFSPKMHKQLKWNFVSTLIFALLFSSIGLGQTLIPNTTPVTQNFDAMAATTTLPANWRVAASTANPVYSSASTTVTQQASSGNPTAGGTYNFGSSTSERAIGAITSGSFASPNNLLGYFRNTNSSTLTQLTVAYDGERYRINTAAASIQFFYSLNGSTWTSVPAGDIAAASFPTGANTYNFTSGTVVNKTGIIISGLNIATNADFYLRWNINTTGANSQGIAVDNVSVTAQFAAAAAAPTVTTNPVATAITSTSATLDGEVVSDGGATILGRGVVWSATLTNANPVIGGSGVTNVTATGTTGAFTVSATSLPVNTQISYRAYGTNSVATSYGAAATFYTLANTPAAPVVTAPASNSLNVSIGGGDGNPASTEYAIQETGSGNYVQADGSLGATAVWQTSATWATVTVTGLTSSTTYNFQVKARNAENVETGFGATGSGTTSAVGMQNQTISFAPLTSQTYGDGSFQLTATASSGLTVTYTSSAPSVATVSGDIVTITGAGTTIITASQEGNSMYNPAPDVSQTLTVAAKNLTVSGATAESKVYDGTTAAIISGATLVGVVGSDDVTVSGGGNFVTANAGTGIAVTPSLVLGGADASNYTLTQPTGLSADITPAPQTITFNPLPNKTTADMPFPLTATTTSGLTITYTSSDPSVATVSGNVVSITGAGTTNITASQAGNGNYQAATSVTQSLTVILAPSVVTYNFGTASGTAAPTGGVPVNNLTVSVISQGNNNGSTPLLSTTSPSSGYTGASGNYNAGAAAFTGALNTATSTYFQFTLTPAVGYKVTFNGISFGSRSTGSGPAAYTLRSSLDNYTSNIATGTSTANSVWALRSPSVTSTASGFGQAVTFRLYGHSGTGSASAGTANWRIDDVSLNLLVETGTACSGTPTAGTASGDATFCVSGSTTITLSGYSDPATTSGTGIQWYSSIDNVNFTPIASATNPTLATGTVTQTTYYYAVVSCSNSGLSATSNTVTITINPNVNPGTVTGSSPLCIGATATYSSNGNTGGTWSSSDGTVASVDANTGVVTALTQGTTNITYTINTGCGAPAPAFQVLEVLKNVNPGIVTGTSPLCIGATATYSTDGDAGGTWSSTNASVATVNANTGVVTALSAGTTDITYTVTTGCNAPVSAFQTLIVNPNVNAGTVSGPTPLIAGNTGQYSTTGDAGGTWSSTNTGVATVDANTGLVTAVAAGTTDITYTISSGCGAPASAFQTLTVEVNAFTITSGAGANGSISPNGVTTVASGGSQSYTITPNTCYHVDNVLVDGSSVGAVTSYTFTNVTANHTISATFALNAPLPTPGPLSGPINACPYVGTGEQVTYSVPALQGATSYTWVVPPTVTIVSGQGTNSITVTFSAGFTAGANKQLRVTALSSCGNSPQATFILVAQLPGTPKPIIASSGNVCGVIGTPGTITYTIPKVTAATSYSWITQAGTTAVSHPNGLGVNDTVVTVSFTNGFTTSAITVQAVNECGTTAARSLTITRNNPATPGPITGPSNACPYIAPNGTAAAYSVNAVANATSYTWTIPANSTGLTGQGTPSISFTYPAGFTSGSVSVTTTNGCGTSGARTLSITKLNPATPGVIDVVQNSACPNRSYSYTISALPSNATSIQWTVPSGATLVSGQGTTSITVSYPATAVSGAVTAQAVNNCGVSVIRSITVKLPACTGGRPEATFSKGMTEPVVNEEAAEAMSVNVFPNPSVTDFKLQVITAGKEKIEVRILDLQGRQVQKINVMAYQTISIGNELKAGSYMIEVRQGKEVKTTRVIRF